MDFRFEEKLIRKSLESGLQKFVSGEYESAWLDFESVLLSDPDTPIANTIGAACLYALGRFDEAEPLSRRGVQLTPSASLARLFLALILSAKGLREEAESEIWETVAVDPSNAGVRVEVGRFLLLDGREEEGRRQLQQAIDIDPDNGEAHFILGVHHLQNSRIDDAEKELAIALNLLPESDSTLAFNGLIRLIRVDDLMRTPLKIEENKRAIELFHRALEINERNELAGECLRVAEESIDRLSRPIDDNTPVERWYDKPMIIWAGYLFYAIAVFALLMWLNESFGIDFWLGLLFIGTFYLLAFCIFIYVKKEFIALPPSIFNAIEKLSNQANSREDASENRVKS